MKLVSNLNKNDSNNINDTSNDILKPNNNKSLPKSHNDRSSNLPNSPSYNNNPNENNVKKTF